MSEADHNPFAAPQSDDVAVTLNGHINYETLRTAGNGLGLIYISLLLIVLMILGVFMSGLFFRGGGPAEFGVVLALGVGLGSLVLTIMSLVGGVMCTTVPTESRAKGLAIASVVLHGLNVVAMIASMFLGGVLGAGLVGMGVLNVFSGISVIVFVLFLRRLSAFIQRTDLTRRATKVLITLGILVMAGIAFFALIRTSNGIATGAVVVIACGVFLVVFLMYANLINEVGKTLRNPDRAPARSHIG